MLRVEASPSEAQDRTSSRDLGAIVFGARTWTRGHRVLGRFSGLDWELREKTT